MIVLSLWLEIFNATAGLWYIIRYNGRHLQEHSIEPDLNSEKSAVGRCQGKRSRRQDQHVQKAWKNLGVRESQKEGSQVTRAQKLPRLARWAGAMDRIWGVC